MVVEHTTLVGVVVTCLVVVSMGCWIAAAALVAAAAVAVESPILRVLVAVARGWVIALQALMTHPGSWRMGNGRAMQSKDFIGRA